MEYDYLIVGGGMTADSAVRGIRQCDQSGRIGLISEETHLPYNRPPLSKSLWTGTQEEAIWRGTDQESVSFHLGRRITSLDPTSKTVTDHQGDVYSYKKLLLAVGGRPKRLSCPDHDVIYFRTLDDYRRLRELYDRGTQFVVIGSGYIGTEIAAALAMNGKEVTLVFRSSSLGCRKYPQGFSQFLSAYFTEKGVRLLPEQEVVKVEGSTVYTNDHKLHADGIIAGIGIEPNEELAREAGLECSDGINVSRLLQTSNPHIFAAGDVANFYSPLLEKRMRCEHENTANTMGLLAGRNMAGAAEEYTHLPSYYSDLFELGYEAVGELGADMDIVEDWQDLYRKGVLYYLRDGRVRGAVLWGIWDELDRIREMIASNKTWDAASLKGRITV